MRFLKGVHIYINTVCTMYIHRYMHTYIVTDINKYISCLLIFLQLFTRSYRGNKFLTVPMVEASQFTVHRKCLCRRHPELPRRSRTAAEVCSSCVVCLLCLPVFDWSVHLESANGCFLVLLKCSLLSLSRHPLMFCAI